jgi:hypothetical protein
MIGSAEYCGDTSEGGRVAWGEEVEKADDR